MFSKRLAPLLALLLCFAGCGGGDGGSTMSTGSSGSSGTQSCNANDCGTVFMGITDADGDFLNYSVDVVSLTLKKANGAVVETLPVSTRVDFTDLVNLTEFVTAATIPNGTYVEGSIRLDYSTAEVTVEIGGVPRPAVVVGDDGQPLGTVDLRIMLDNRNHVVVSPGRPSLLQLDFDLAASHTVDLTTNPVKATAKPFIVATVEPVDEKEIRVRGPLLSVDTATSTYTIDVRPFNLRDARLGRLTVHTTADTAFEIDGQTYTGAAGLATLAQSAAGTPTAAFGTLSRTERQFTAERVHAGSSVPGPNFDVLWGNVTARDGNTLTVRGATLIRRSGSVAFVRDDMSLLVGDATQVTKDGQRGDDLGNAAISVGQRIHAFGQVSTSTTGDITVDAQQGRVRLQLTHLSGMITSSNPGNLTLDLASIDGRRPAVFDFRGTGTSAGTDADPTNYEVATGALNLNLLPAGSPTRVFGFVTPFGAAPPDFSGRTIVDFSEVKAVLGLGWGLQGTSAPFLSIGTEGLTIDNANASIGLRHFIAIGPRLIDIKTLASPPRIVARADLSGLFAIGSGRQIEVFGDFAAFTARLAEKLGAGNKALAMSATGEFDIATSTLTARQVSVSLSSSN